MTFRLYRIALTADIEKAFQMGSVNQDDRDVLRFVWVDNIKKDNPNILIYGYARVVFGLNSPFLLNATLKHHISKYQDVDPEFMTKMLNSLYVDDLNSGENCVCDAFSFYQKAKSITSDGGFNLRKWMSNSNELMDQINKSEDTASACESLVKVEDGTYFDYLLSQD